MTPLEHPGAVNHHSPGSIDASDQRDSVARRVPRSTRWSGPPDRSTMTGVSVRSAVGLCRWTGHDVLHGTKKGGVGRPKTRRAEIRLVLDLVKLEGAGFRGLHTIPCLKEAGMSRLMNHLRRIAAAALGRSGLVRQLLEAKADVDAANPSGATALIAAAFAGDVATLELLLAQSASLERKTRSGVRALQAAVEGNQSEAVELLLSTGAELDAADAVGATALHRCATAGLAPLAQRLCAAGAAVDAASAEGLTPLMLAAMRGHSDVMAELLEFGAELELEDAKGGTALFQAASTEGTDEETELETQTSQPTEALLPPNAEDPEDKGLHPMSVSRRCTDWGWHLPFLVMIAGSVWITRYAQQNAKIDNIFTAPDFLGYKCGQKFRPHEPYLYFCMEPPPVLDSNATDEEIAESAAARRLNARYPICVSECPSSSNTSSRCFVKETSNNLISQLREDALNFFAWQEVEDYPSWPAADLVCRPDPDVAPQLFEHWEAAILTTPQNVRLLLYLAHWKIALYPITLSALFSLMLGKAHIFGSSDQSHTVI
ncbi:unnamed protein product [Durusdinium trenchii]|uniref:Uncharacterized protein n=1 Tax=Durusdinium trenchii TaxID=1381693 RepID=A0ABP0Q800_9DINO